MVRQREQLWRDQPTVQPLLRLVPADHAETWLPPPRARRRLHQQQLLLLMPLQVLLLRRRQRLVMLLELGAQVPLERQQHRGTLPQLPRTLAQNPVCVGLWLRSVHGPTRSMAQ